MAAATSFRSSRAVGRWVKVCQKPKCHQADNPTPNPAAHTTNNNSRGRSSASSSSSTEWILPQPEEAGTTQIPRRYQVVCCPPERFGHQCAGSDLENFIKSIPGGSSFSLVTTAPTRAGRLYRGEAAGNMIHRWASSLPAVSCWVLNNAR